MDALIFHRLPNALHDLGRIVVDYERDGALEAWRAGNEKSQSTLEWIGGDPRFIRAAPMATARAHGRLDTLTIARYALDVEQQGTAECA